MTSTSRVIAVPGHSSALARVERLDAEPLVVGAIEAAASVATFDPKSMKDYDDQSLIDCVGRIKKGAKWLDQDRRAVTDPVNEFLKWFRGQYDKRQAVLDKALDRAKEIDRARRAAEAMRIENERVQRAEEARKAAAKVAKVVGLDAPPASVFVLPQSNVRTGGQGGKSIGRRDLKVEVVDIVALAQARPYLLELKAGPAISDLRALANASTDKHGEVDGLRWWFEESTVFQA